MPASHRGGRKESPGKGPAVPPHVRPLPALPVGTLLVLAGPLGVGTQGAMGLQQASASPRPGAVVTLHQLAPPGSYVPS